MASGTAKSRKPADSHVSSGSLNVIFWSGPKRIVSIELFFIFSNLARMSIVPATDKMGYLSAGIIPFGDVLQGLLNRVFP